MSVDQSSCQLHSELEEANRRLSDRAIHLASVLTSDSGRNLLKHVWASFQQVRSTPSRQKTRARAFAEIIDAHPAGSGPPLSRIGIPIFPGQDGFTSSASQDAGQLLLLGSLYLGMLDPTDAPRQARLWDIIVGADIVNTILRNALLGKPFGPEPRVPPVIVDYVADFASRNCLIGVGHAMTALRQVLGAWASRSHANGITQIDPHEGCAGQLVTVRGRGFGRQQPLGVEVYFPTISGNCQVAKVKVWGDTAIQVYAPKNVGSGCVGFVVHGTSRPQSITQAVSTFIGEVTECLGPLAAEPIRAGYQSLASGAFRVPCPPCLPGGLNRFTGGPPVIEYFYGEVTRNTVTFPGSGVVDLGQRDVLELKWQVTNAAQVTISPVAISGQLHELPLVSGPFAKQGTKVVNWAGNNPLVYSAFPWDAAYELHATNKCGSVVGRVTIRMRMPPKSPPGPTDFLWGVATAGRQVEGNLTGDDWHIFTNESRILQRLQTFKDNHKELSFEPKDAGVALNHWAWGEFAHSVERARALGLNAYRFSIEWSRIEPNRGRFDTIALGNYQMMIAAVRTHGMEPIVVLNHLSLPAWVQTPPRESINTCCDPGGYDGDPDYKNSLRGWETTDTVDAYVRYVEFVVSSLANNVSWWITFNEPLATAIPTGYLAGVFPPGFLGDGGKAMTAIHNIITAHARAYESIHKIDANARVGITDQWLFCKDVLDPNATKQFVYYHQDFLINALVHGNEDRDISHSTPKNERVLGITAAKWRPHVDFFGLQYYKSVYPYHFIPLAITAPWFGARVDLDLKNAKDPHNLLNDMGWEVSPVGLYECLMKLKKIARFKKRDLPILVAENGTAEIVDHNRSPYITSHVQQLQRARKDGASVVGYLHWSIADNWEWIDGYRQEARFGLFTVDRSSLELRHSITEGALALSYAMGDPKVTVDAAVSRYGRYRSDGVIVEHPTMSPYSIWQGLIDGKPITVLLASLPYTPSPPPARQTNLTGLLFYSDLRRWVRLNYAVWDPVSKTLHFSHPGYSISSPIPERLFAGVLDATSISLVGQVTESHGNTVLSTNWQIKRLPFAGMWQGKMGSSLLTLSLSYAEDHWTGRVLWDKDWQPFSSIQTNPTGFIAHMSINASIFAAVAGSYTPSSSSMTIVPWGVTVQRLPDGLPF